MINYRATEKDFWNQVVSEQIQAASDAYIADPNRGYHDPVLMAEPYWLSVAKPGDVFFFKDNDGHDVWQKCTVKECVHDVVFYTSIPVDKPELAPLYAGISHMDIGSRANQHAFLHRAECHIKKGDPYQYASACPYTKIIIDE